MIHVLVEEIDPVAAVDPEPPRAVVQRRARVAEHGGDDEIGGVAGDRIPVGKRERLVVQHLANHALELIQHQSVPGQEKPLLVLLGVGGVVGVGLAAVPHRLGVGSMLRRERRDHFRLSLLGQIPQGRRKPLDPMGVPPPLPGTLIVFRQLAHDLDRLCVLREHHLALGAVDVVAHVGLLRSLRRRRVRARRRGADVRGRSSGSAGLGRRPHRALRRRRRRRAELQLQDVVIRRVRLKRRIQERQHPGGLDHPAHQVKAVADHAPATP